MLKLINEITKYDTKKIRKEIDNYLAYIKWEKNIKKNLFYKKRIDNIYEWILDLLDIYNKVKYKGSIYLLTKEIENIKYIYISILNLEKEKNIKLPEILKTILNENIKNIEINNKINVFKDIELIKLLFIKKWLISKDFNRYDFSFKNIKKKVKYDLFLDIEYLLKDDNNLLDFLIWQNVTTIHNRNTYDYEEAIKRIKKDFLYQMNIYILDNKLHINTVQKDISQHIKNFNIKFWYKILKRYIMDFIYYCYFFKDVPNIEIVNEINSELLFKIETSIMNDYYIIAEDNIDLYNFLQQNLIIMFKYWITWNFDEELYIINNKNDKNLINFFQYRIYD